MCVFFYKYSYRICTSAQLPKWCGGIEGRAVFIATNKNFGSHRLKGSNFKKIY